MTYHQLLSTIPAVRRPSINVPYNRDTFNFVNFHQLSMQPGELPLTSVNFLCGRETFCQLLSTFHAARKPSVNFSRLSVRPGDLLSSSVKFSRSLKTFRQLPSTLVAAGRPVNFCQIIHATRRTTIYLHKFPYCPGDLLSNSVKFLHGREIFRQLPSKFCVARRSSVNFCQIFVQLGSLPST